MFENETLYSALAVMFLAILARVIVPKMLGTPRAGVRFALGTVIFGLYTAAMLIVFRAFGANAATAEECYSGLMAAFLITNAVVLFFAFLYFLIRDKRKLSEMEKMKLADL